MSNTLIAITGPTASGKTTLGVQIAKELNGEVISVDSVQVYKGVRVGACTPSDEELQGIPHHMFEVLEPDKMCDVAWYKQQIEKFILEIRSRGRVPVLVGGTNLYLEALFKGLSDLPKANPSIRAQLEQLTNEQLFEDLIRADKVSALNLHCNDRVRVIRALEICMVTGLKASSLKGQSSSDHIGVIINLCWNRADLYERINQRSKSIVDNGLLDETKSILESCGSQAPVLRTLGFSEAKDFLASKLSQQELIDSISQSTRRFAKRQTTFWRNSPQKFSWSTRPVPKDAQVELENADMSKPKRLQAMNVKALSLSFFELLALLKAELKTSNDQEPRKTQVWQVSASALLEDLSK